MAAHVAAKRPVHWKAMTQSARVLIWAQCDQVSLVKEAIRSAEMSIVAAGMISAGGTRSKTCWV